MKEYLDDLNANAGRLLVLPAKLTLICSVRATRGTQDWSLAVVNFDASSGRLLCISKSNQFNGICAEKRKSKRGLRWF